MSIHEFFNMGSDGRFSLVGNARMKEGEIVMIQSPYSSTETAAQISYGFIGVVLSAALDSVYRGDRFQGRFACRTGIFGSDATDPMNDDENGFLLWSLDLTRLND
jgi:hypothetical protein